MPPATRRAAAATDRRQTDLSFRGIATGAMFVWVAGTLLMLVRLARNCGRVVQLRRSSRPLQNDRLQTLLRQVAARLGMRQVPLLLVSSRAIAPLAVGFGRPAVILPERLLGAVSDNELRGRPRARGGAPSAGRPVDRAAARAGRGAVLADRVGARSQSRAAAGARRGLRQCRARRSRRNQLRRDLCCTSPSCW